MMVMAAFFVPVLIGFYSLRLIMRTRLDWLENFLAAGLGVGISAQIVFYSLVLAGRFNPVLIILAHLFVLFGLYGTDRFVNKNRKDHRFFSRPSIALFLVVFALFIFLMIVFALARPYGDWDGWALWNFRANFIYRAGGRWWDIMGFNLHGHPPWFLPLFTAGGWAWAGREDVMVPILTSVLGTFLTIGILVYGLSCRVKPWKALFGGVYLCSIPYFLNHATSQYADIWVAYYVLAVVVCLQRRLFFISGVLGGLLCLSKNEGMILAPILLGMSLIFVQDVRRHWWALLAGVFCVLPAVVIPQMLMTGDLPGINQTNMVYLLDVKRWQWFMDFIVRQVVLSPHWGGLWVIAAAMLLVFRGLWDITIKVCLGTLMVFFVIFMALYVMVVYDFYWRISVSWDRLMFQITPLVVYMMFSCWRKKEE